MKKISIYLLVIFIVLVIQITAIPVIFDRIWVPDFVLVMIIAWALVDGFESFFPWAIISGILYDLLSFSVVGVNVIIFILATYAVGFFSRRFSTEMRGTGLMLSIFFVFSATLGSKIISLFFGGFNNYSLRGFEKIFFSIENILTAFIWNIIFFVLFFYFINKLEDYFLLRKKTNIIVR